MTDDSNRKTPAKIADSKFLANFTFQIDAANKTQPKQHSIVLAVAAFFLGLMVASNVGCSNHRPGSNVFQPSNLKAISFTSEKSKAPPIRDLVSGEELSEIIRKSQGHVIVDFYADWCGPCKKQSTVLHALEDQLSGSDTTVIKVNADHFPDLKKKYDVAGLPTLLLVRDGVVADRSVGLTRGKQLQNWIR